MSGYDLIQAIEFWDRVSAEVQETKHGMPAQLATICVSGFARQACATGVLTETELLQILTILKPAYHRRGPVTEFDENVPDRLPEDIEGEDVS